jgi:hypothetical protein
LLELNDGRWAVSVSGGRDRERFARPVVRVVRHADGSPADGSESIDLFERKGKLAPRRVLDVVKAGIDLSGVIGKAFNAVAA